MRAKPWEVSDELWERFRLVLPVKERLPLSGPQAVR
jgi:hypothetical protein